MKELFFVIDINIKEIRGKIFPLLNYLEARKSNIINSLKGSEIRIERQSIVYSTMDFVKNLISVIDQFLYKLNINKKVLCGIGISVDSIVNNYLTKGGNVENDTELFKKNDWERELKNYYSCRVIISEHKEALAFGMADLGFLSGDKAIGIVTVGYASRFMVWRNGRKWASSSSEYPFVNLYSMANSYNEWNEGSKIFLDNTYNGLMELFQNSKNTKFLNVYWERLSEFITIIIKLYSLDGLYLSGALIEAGTEMNYNFYNIFHSRFGFWSAKMNKTGFLKEITEEGLNIRIRGITAMIVGETIACAKIKIPAFDSIETEIPYDGRLVLHQKRAEEIVKILWEAEEKAGEALKQSLSVIAKTAKKMALALSGKGRIIYIGAGTSGRIAAIDAVEIPCTYGLPKDKILSVIAGGVMDTCIDSESDFEEDKSSLGDMLLLNINEADVVIGISASGSSYFVQSALAFAKFRGAYTAMVQNTDSISALSFYDSVIPLHSGSEVIAGSIRMKAGTSTKKVLNFLSSTATILSGNVYGPYMINITCINNKLKSRAESILCTLFNLPPEESREILKENNYNLKKACSTLLFNKDLNNNRIK